MARLHQRLRDAGHRVVTVREPGGTPLGERIRSLVKHETKLPLCAEAELLLFAASRAQLVVDVIRPALQAGAVVLADRFSASTYAYQGFGRGLDIDAIGAVLEVATGGLTPHLTVLLDILPDVRAARRAREHGAEGGRKAETDRFEDEDMAFAARVRAGYLTLAAAAQAAGAPAWLVIDGARPPDEVAEAVWQGVIPLLGPGNK